MSFKRLWTVSYTHLDVYKRQILDNAAVLDFFAENAGEPDGLIAKLAARTDFWGEDLTEVPGFTETAEDWFRVIRDAGMSEAFRKAAEEMCIRDSSEPL